MTGTPVGYDEEQTTFPLQRVWRCRCPTFQNFAHDITSIDVDFLHRCHVGFQWFKMCSIQLDELVSMSGGRYWRDMMDHHKVKKTMAFNVRVHDELNGTNSYSIQE